MCLVKSLTPSHRMSLTTTRIEQYASGKYISHGTGFIARYKHEYALVTNWHVLSGKDPSTGKLLKDLPIKPDEIQFSVTVADKVGFVSFSETKKSRRNIKFKLYDDNDVKKWTDLERINYRVDVGLILLNDLIPEIKSGYGLVHIDAAKFRDGDIYNAGEIYPADYDQYIIKNYPQISREIRILGYPKDIEMSEHFPIWKSGSIASEPNATVKKDGILYKDLLYVDALSRSGMSGSPVLYFAPEGDKMWSADKEFMELEFRGIYLVGVYAGRDGATDDENEFAIGRVWKAEVLPEMFRAAIKKRDEG